MLSPGMQSRCGVGEVPRLPPSSRPGRPGRSAGDRRATRCADVGDEPGEGPAAAVPRALITVRSCNEPDDACGCSAPRAHEDETSACRGSSSCLTGWTTISVRSRSWPCIAVVGQDGDRHLGGVAQVASGVGHREAEHHRCAGIGGGRGAGRSYLRRSRQAPSLGALTENVVGSMFPFTSVQLSSRLIGTDWVMPTLSDSLVQTGAVRGVHRHRGEGTAGTGLVPVHAGSGAVPQPGVGVPGVQLNVTAMMPPGPTSAVVELSPRRRLNGPPVGVQVVDGMAAGPPAVSPTRRPRCGWPVSDP